MPEQASARANAVTSAEFEQPFETFIFPLGVGGLDLVSAVDKVAVGRFTRLTNCIFLPGEARTLTSRPGQTALATAGTNHHSIVRMNDIEAATFTRVWGIDTEVYLGQSGALVQVDTGYSGNPLTLLPYRPPLSGDPWVYIADSARMRKIRFDGTVTEIGLPAPANAATPVLDAQATTMIEPFTVDTWTPNAGSVIVPAPNILIPVSSVPTTTGPSIFEMKAPPVSALATGGLPYYQFWGLPKALDLNTVGGVPATDDDLMHLFLAFTRPQNLVECRLYLVCSPLFSASILPGTSATVNTDFYVKTFTPSELNAFIAGVEAANKANTGQSSQILVDTTIQESLLADGYSGIRAGSIVRANADFAATQDPTRSVTVPASPAAKAFTEFGITGVPLRRGDWQRFGTTAGCDWGTITGLVIYMQANENAGGGAEPGVTLLDWYLAGGGGLDTTDPATQSYDWRYTHYDPRTGAEGNPSPVMDPTNFLDASRQGATIGCSAYGNAAVRQRFYRRGGTLTADWYFLGVNASDGGSFTDTESDLGIAAGDTLQLDHYQPVPTVDDAGNTVLAQPVPVIFGPYNGQVFALGDPHRAGHVYASLPGAPDHWPPDLACEVCPPSEELLNGCMFSGQPFVWSRLGAYTLYANLTGQNGMTVAPSGCKRGLAGRWALTQGYGFMWFVSNDGVYRTTGGVEEPISLDLWDLFHGQSVNGYRPIDLSVEVALRLALFENELYFGYQDDQGNRQVLVYQILTNQWRAYSFAHGLSTLYQDEGGSSQLLLGGATTGKSYTLSGTSDDGTSIQAKFRTGSLDHGRPREEKLYGDQILDVDTRGVDLTWRNYLNDETIVNPIQTYSAAAGRQRAIFDSFGLEPQHGRTIATEVVWDTTADAPIVYYLGTAVTFQPDVTMNRVTNWDDLGTSDEKYVTGITLDCNTGGTDRTIIIERDFNGAISTVATLTVNANTRHKLRFSWPAQPCNQVRIRPEDTCEPWMLFRADWIAVPEPPRIAGWDVHFENAWDQYYTGLDLYCDTFGADKTVEVYVDEVLIKTETVNTNGRKVHHITLPWGRGHVFHFVATDANVGLLYSHRWHLQEEPSEQTNWNEPFTILGTQADKWLKAIIFECDTFGQNKSVQVEADGAVVTTLTVNTNGRKVVQIAIPEALGRVWRFFPVDNNPGRLYSKRPVFDEEPFCLDRWETQETDHDLGGFHSLIESQITLKSTDVVTLTVQTILNQSTGAAVTDSYTIPSTGGVKRMAFVPFNARNGMLYKYLFTSPAAFWLYQEESHVVVQPFIGGQPIIVRPFGNSDADRTRSMVNTSIAAARSGGGSA